MTCENPDASRYDRQVRFAPLGEAGQQRLARARVLIVGAGGLGSNLAEHLGRAGVGLLRLVDDDPVELVNLHRQHLYTEADVQAGLAKPLAAAERLRRINSQVRVEPVLGRLEAGNALELLDGMDLALDGTDNWPGRFIINDACVKVGTPWVFAGVVAAEAVTMTIVPGRTPCLRCVYESPPPPEASPTCRDVGVLGPAVGMIAAWQAAEALKLLCGRADAINPDLVRFDLWGNRIQRMRLPGAQANCPCCGQRCFEFLAS